MNKKKIAIVVCIVLIMIVCMICLLQFNSKQNKIKENNEKNRVIIYGGKHNQCDFPVEFLDTVKEYYKNINFTVTQVYDFYYSSDKGIEGAENSIIYQLPNREEYQKMMIPNGDYEVVVDSKKLTKSMIRRGIYGYEESRKMTVDQYIEYLKEKYNANKCQLIK